MTPELTASDIFTAETNDDGRVSGWTSVDAEKSLQKVFHSQSSHAETDDARVWRLRFSTGAYYEAQGVQCFFPRVEVHFVVKARNEHYHVPLLLGPYNYSTYRGS